MDISSATETKMYITLNNESEIMVFMRILEYASNGFGNVLEQDVAEMHNELLGYSRELTEFNK